MWLLSARNFCCSLNFLTKARTEKGNSLRALSSIEMPHIKARLYILLHGGIPGCTQPWVNSQGEAAEAWLMEVVGEQGCEAWNSTVQSKQWRENAEKLVGFIFFLSTGNFSCYVMHFKTLENDKYWSMKEVTPFGGFADVLLQILDSRKLRFIIFFSIMY